MLFRMPNFTSFFLVCPNKAAINFHFLVTKSFLLSDLQSLPVFEDTSPVNI